MFVSTLQKWLTYWVADRYQERGGARGGGWARGCSTWRRCCPGWVSSSREKKLSSSNSGEVLESIYEDDKSDKCPYGCHKYLLIRYLLALALYIWRHLRVVSFSMGWLSGEMSRVVGSFLQTTLPPRNSPLATKLLFSRLRLQ